MLGQRACFQAYIALHNLKCSDVTASEDVGSTNISRTYMYIVISTTESITDRYTEGYV